MQNMQTKIIKDNSNTHTNKVGDLAEAWSWCTNRQVEIAGCIHAKHANKRIQLKHTNKE